MLRGWCVEKRDEDIMVIKAHNIEIKPLSSAIEIFRKLEKGILTIINAADIYCVHLIAKYRNGEVDKDLIDRLLISNRISGHALHSWSYKNKEIKALEESRVLKGIGQQIVLAACTALEFYLIEKFKEYYRYKLQAKNTTLVEKSIEKFYFRGLDDIRTYYWELLEIHLPSFDIEYHTAEKSSFHPKDSWDAIRTLSKARNEIAHYGESEVYNVITLLDAWYPFDFVRRWVILFDANFDSLIYKGYETNPIKKYKKKISKTEIKVNEKMGS